MAPYFSEMGVTLHKSTMGGATSPPRSCQPSPFPARPTCTYPRPPSKRRATRPPAACAFALLRGLTIDALVSKYWSLMASSALTPPTPTILPLEIASVYASIKSAFSEMPSVTNYDAQNEIIKPYSPRVVVLARTMMLSLNSNIIGLTPACAPRPASNSYSDVTCLLDLYM